MQKRVCILLVCAAVALFAIARLLAALWSSQSVPELTKRDVFEIRMCEWRMAWGDIAGSYSIENLRAAPGRLWFTLAHAGKPSQPNTKGWVWGALLVPGQKKGEWIIYGGQKQSGRWVLKRLPMAES